MIAALWRQQWRANIALVAAFAALFSLYVWAITAMYDPQTSAMLEAMTESMPQVFSAFGMDEAPGSLDGFIVNYLYGFLLVLLPLILMALLVYRLLVRPVERGSMAYVLSAGRTRLQVVMTLLAALVSLMLALMAWVTLMEVVAGATLASGELDVWPMVRVNLGLAALWLVVAGLLWCGTCVSPHVGKGLWAGAGFCLLSFILQMVAQLGDDLAWVRYLTFLTCFDRYGLLDGEAAACWQAGVLAGAGVLLCAVGTVAFAHRDIAV